MANTLLKEKKQNNGKFLGVFKETPYFTLRSKWLELWNGSPPDKLLIFLGLLVAILMSIPIVYVVIRSAFAGSNRWMNLLNGRIPFLLFNTIYMAAVVTIGASFLGVTLSWLINRCDVPGGKIWRWLLALPLVIPPYVGSMTYIVIFGPRGWIRDLLGNSTFNIFSFWGTAFVLIMFTYPYVFLITGTALRRMNRNYEDSGRVMGLKSSEIFWKVTLPFLRPSIGAGMILVSLYVLSDFGAVAMLRYPTFTTAIYYQMASYDNLSATVLSSVLIGITIFILWAEEFTRRKQRFVQTGNTMGKPEELPLGHWKLPVLFYISLIFFISVILPITVLIYWSVIGFSQGAILNNRFWGYAVNSLKVSAISALFSMVIGLPIVYLKSRHPSIITTIMYKLSYSGYALPGVIVSLGIIFLFNQYIPSLYNKYILISIGYLIRFLPQAMQSVESSLSQISPRIDEAARNLGYSPLKVLYRVVFPLIIPGVLAGGAIVFVSSIKELPATLLLRPPGFDTLAVRVWVEASEAVYHMAAPPALLIVLISIIPLKWMLTKY